MNLLSPLFLAGTALIAGPIIFHLIRRATRNRIGFSATEFLSESPPRLQRRSRIQNPWLLLLRCLVIGLLALAFARPYFSKEIPILPQGATPKIVAIALDESASMQRQGIWDDAIDKTLEEASKLGPADQLAIIAFARSAQTILGYDQWTKTPFSERSVLLGKLLAERKPGWNSTSLDLGVETAIEELEELTELQGEVGEKEIILISDLTKGSRVANLAGRDWPPDTRLRFYSASPESPGNVGIQWLGWSKMEGQGRKARIGLRSSGLSEPARIELTLSDALTDTKLGKSIDLRIAGDETRLLLVDVPPDSEGPFRLELTGDRATFDNVIHFTPNQPRQLSIRHYGSGDLKTTDHAAFFLGRAITGWKDPVVDLHILAPGSSDQPETESSYQDSFLVVNRELYANELAEVRSLIEKGSYALFLLKGDRSLQTLQSLAGESDWQPKRVEGEYALLGRIDFQHPLFNLFADPKYSDFSKIRFWKAQSIDLPPDSQTNVVASFDDGSPAVIEKAIGKGRLIIWGGDWSSEASQWVLSTKFVPWFQRLVERSIGGQAKPSIASIDEPNIVSIQGLSQWKTMDGGTLDQETPQTPGLYRITEDNRERWAALNLSIEESQTSPLETDVWDQLGVPLEAAKRTAQSAAEIEKSNRLKNAIELESQQKLWKWLIIATIGFLILESLIAINLGKRRETAVA